jgi:hypothetical protein
MAATVDNHPTTMNEVLETVLTDSKIKAETFLTQVQ